MSKKKLFKVSIGIPAFNEEGNIKILIEALLRLSSRNFRLLEIIVISDKSTDKTEEEVRSIKDKRIVFLKNKKRIGQALTQNKILKKFKGDILVLLNADTLPKDKNLIENLVKPFYKNRNLGLVGGKVVPLKPINYFENVISYSHIIKQELYEKLGNNNIYLCHGRVRAFSRAFSKKIRWEPVAGEDAFSYFSCLTAGFDFYYQKNAQVYFRSPQTLKDHFRQSTRFLHRSQLLEAYFDTKLVKERYFIPKKILIKSFIKGLKNKPKLFLSYLTILFLAKLKSYTAKPQSAWDPSVSSKKLVT